METKEIFGAAPYSVSEFFSDPGLGLYIPPYQRPYNWDRNKVRRLIEDIGHGLGQLAEISESICFLGTVIALRDMNYTTVDPVYHSQVPNKLLTIIDGQQRLSSLLILLTVLHDEIRIKARSLKRGEGPEEWCYNQAQDVRARLATTFQENMNYGDAAYQYYPRMIRAYDDVWSRSSNEAKYTSSIACYLFEYAKYARADDTAKPFSFTWEEDKLEATSETAGSSSFKHLRGIRDDVRSLLRRQLRAGQEDDDLETSLLPTEVIIDSPRVRNELFPGGVPNNVCEAAGEDAKVSDILRLMVFANFLLQRVTVALVTAKREDFGFDMFEALNTTGEPLTALETFKPRVIQSLGLAAWRTSKSKMQFDQIEAFLGDEAASSADKRQSVTADLLVSFALLQSGKRLGKRLSEQRRYMRQSFDEEVDVDGRAGYVEALANLTNFLRQPWRKPAMLNEQLSGLEGEATFALGVLAAGKHDIVVPLLARYWTAYRLAQSDARVASYTEFLKAARSCVAFYGLWRGALRGTSGIDDVHRNLMSRTDSKGRTWARGGQGSLTDLPSTTDLNIYLREQLAAKGLNEKANWVRLVAANAAYSQKALTRFLLIAASNDSLPDVKARGLLRRGKAGVLPLMTLKNWTSGTLATIEHVAPQSITSGTNDWGIEFGDNPELLNTLGNLTLLPTKENSSAGDKPWATKRLFYQVLSASTIVDAERLLEAAAEEGLVLHSGAQEIVQASQFLPLVSAIATRDDAWDAGFIRTRGERLAELAWDSLVPWIGIDEI